MDAPNTSLLDQVFAAYRGLQSNAVVPPQALPADVATSQCLALLTDPGNQVLPAAAFQELAKRNAALLAAPKVEIKAALSRQVVLLEAASIRFLSKAALAAKPEHVAVLMKLGLGCSRSLLAVLAAINSLERDDNSKEINGTLA